MRYCKQKFKEIYEETLGIDFLNRIITNPLNEK